MLTPLKTAILGLLATTAVVAASCKSNDDVVEPAKKTGTIVLVHGAWQGAFAWAPVKTSLEQKGYTVVNVELPAHGDDQTPVAGLSLTSYRDKVIAAINAQTTGKVLLVGHSLGGMVISEVAEQMPAKVSKLVYVAGFLPQNQQSIQDLSALDPQALLSPALEFNADFSLASVKAAELVNVFCQDASTAVQQLLLAKNRPEPAAPIGEKITLTAANFGPVPKYYVHTLQDHAITPSLQTRMVQATPVQREFSLNTGHTPMLSQPNELTTILDEIAQLQ
jgi:pimeloyl-ACP methyl ester carboxylesterase